MSTGTDDVSVWASRVRARYPKQAARYTSDQLRASMAGWVALLAPYGIEAHEDRVRFLALAVLLTPEQRRSKLATAVLQYTMDHMDWEPKQRLDFLYKHLVGRPVAADEEDFGPAFSAPLAPDGTA